MILELLGAVALLVALAYAVLRRWPLLVHRSHQDHISSELRAARVVAHRGGKLAYHENTLASFAHALRSGACMLEFDLHFTADRKIVVFHDPTFARLCGGDADADARFLAECTYDDLPLLDDERCDAQREAWFGEDQARSQLRRVATKRGSDRWLRTIPTLEEVFDLVTNWPGSAPTDLEVPGFSTSAAVAPHCPPTVLLEFKINDEELIRRVRTMVDVYELSSRAMWFSLNKVANAALRKSEPLTGLATLPTLTAFQDVFKICLLWAAGLLPFLPLHDPVFGFPVGGVLSFKGVRRFKASEILPDWLVHFLINAMTGAFQSPGLRRHLHRRGMVTTVLIVNSVGDLTTARRIGTTQFLTDDPEWVVEQLRLEEWNAGLNTSSSSGNSGKKKEQ